MWSQRGWKLCSFAFCLALLAGQTTAQAPFRPDAQRDGCSAGEDWWSGVEAWVWARICAGEVADLRHRDGRWLDPKSEAGWDEGRLVSSQFLESILSRDPYRSWIPRQGVQVVNALFDNPLDLSNAQLKHILTLERCAFSSDVNLDRLRAPRIGFPGSVFHGTVDLDDSNISGSVNFVGATVKQELSLNSARIGAHLLLHGGAEFNDVVLNSSTIGGRLDTDGSRFRGTLYGSNIHVGSNISLSKGAEFKEIKMVRGNVGGNVAFANAIVHGLASFNSSQIDGHLFLYQQSSFGELNLNAAKIGGGVDMSSGSFGNVLLSGAAIGVELRLASGSAVAKWNEDARMNLRNLRVDALADAPDAWPAHVVLDGFRYQRISGLGTDEKIGARNSADFINWLSRVEPFTPQPYTQLAAVLRNMGNGDMANAVLYEAKERSRSLAWERANYASWAGQTLLKWTIGYGLGTRYFRALAWVLGLVMLGTVLLRLSGQSRVPGEDGKPEMDIGFFYSLDVLLPVIQLRQRHYEVDLQGWIRHYFYFHQMMGYVLASFLIAGLSGLTT